jgi:hypothetical protein
MYIGLSGKNLKQIQLIGLTEDSCDFRLPLCNFVYETSNIADGGISVGFEIADVPSSPNPCQGPSQFARSWTCKLRLAVRLAV